MSRAFLLAAAPALALALAPPARAQPIDLSHGGPVDVTASDGIELHQNEQMVVARGNARAVRDNVTVTADVLIARYRKKAGAADAKAPDAKPAAAPPAGAKPSAPGGDLDTGGNEIYRLEAEGNVHIYTQTDTAVADRAVYDIDQAVLVLTGAHMKVTTPSEVMTARDSIEYWSQKHMAVGRGDAVVVTNDGRRLAADVLVGYTTDSQAQQASGAGTKPPVQKASAAQPADPLAASGKLQKVEAFGHVEVRTATEIVLGDRGVYTPDSGIARIAGHVRITRGDNQLNGNEAEVNLRTGISRLISAPGRRVEGLVVPNESNAGDKPGGEKPGGAPAPAAGGRR